MATPGDESTDCPRCGGDRILIGHGSAVHAVYCGRCDLTVSITGDAMSTVEVREASDGWDPDEWDDGPAWGPDPWG